MIYYSPKYKAGVGGKAEGLYKLRKLGLKVPDFLVIPHGNFEKTITEGKAGSQEPVNIFKQLLKYKLPAQDWEQLKDILQQWGFPNNPVVVRSSVLDEDGAKNAFPGVMDSFLNISSYKELEKAIAECAASAWSTKALVYREQHQLDPVARPAVIVQQQIDPDASGVLFTTFPNYPQEMAIHSVPGFAQGLLDGNVEGDEFYFLKKSGKLHRQIITTKTTGLQRSGSGGLEPAEIEKEKQGVPCVNVKELKQIFQCAQEAEKLVGFPLDMEFAIKNGELFFLQARPITQGIPEVVVYDNSNIQESYCGVTTPLTFSFASRAYTTVYRQTMQVLGLSSGEIFKNEQVLSNLLGLVKGRIYYNINNWYRGLQLLPSFKQNKADMELMMGLQEPIDFIGDVEKSLVEKIKLLPGLIKNFYRLWRKFSKLHKLVPEFQQNFRKHYDGFYEDLSPTLKLAELLQKKKALDENLLNSWSIPIINDFNVMMVNGAVIRNLKRAGISEPEEFLGRFLSGDQEIESTQPTIAMIDLAEQAGQIEKLKKLILDLPMNLHQKVQETHPQFFVEVTNFIHRYGDRTVGELKLETNTMRVDPQIFYKYLRNFLSADKLVKVNMQLVSVKAEAELENALSGKNFFFKRKLRKKLGKLQLAIRYRESMRLERTRLFGMYRSIYRAYGNYLVENGVLDRVEDVFYLTEDEMINSENINEFKKLVTARKTEFGNYSKVEVPSRVIIPSPPVEEEKQPEDPQILKGQGCFPGQKDGEVVVIKDPGDDLDVNNKIICALRTDPGWAALFPTCKGVLIEKGSALSHSVILLRELGIPTIINIPNLCNRLVSGEKVNINGSTGEIIREK